MLPLRLAGCWWSGGLGIHGRNAGLLATALCLPYAMLWLEEIGYHSVRGRVLRNLEGHADRGALRDRKRGVDLHHVTTARLSVEAWRRFQIDGGRRWHGFPKAGWGKSFEADHLFSILIPVRGAQHDVR